MIITVAHMKGGTGKTTTAAHLLAALAAADVAAAGIDADTQGSLVGWADAVGASFPTVEVVASPRGVTEAADRFRRTHDHVVIDTPNDPGRSQAAVSAALQVSDLAIVPVAPTPLEFLRLSPTAEVIGDARQHRPGLRAAVLLSRVRAATRSAGEARAALVDAGWEVLRTEVPLREAIAQSAGAAEPHEAYARVLDEVLTASAVATRS